MSGLPWSKPGLLILVLVAALLVLGRVLWNFGYGGTRTDGGGSSGIRD